MSDEIECIYCSSKGVEESDKKNRTYSNKKRLVGAGTLVGQDNSV